MAAGAAKEAVVEKTATKAAAAVMRRRSGPTATDEGRCKLFLLLLLICNL